MTAAAPGPEPGAPTSRRPARPAWAASLRSPCLLFAFAAVGAAAFLAGYAVEEKTDWLDRDPDHTSRALYPIQVAAGALLLAGLGAATRNLRTEFFLVGGLVAAMVLVLAWVVWIAASAGSDCLQDDAGNTFCT